MPKIVGVANSQLEIVVVGLRALGQLRIRQGVETLAFKKAAVGEAQAAWWVLEQFRGLGLLPPVALGHQWGNGRVAFQPFAGLGRRRGGIAGIE